jgi:hypothetical protein
MSDLAHFGCSTRRHRHVAPIFYRIIDLIRGTRAVQMLIGLAVVFLAYLSRDLQPSPQLDPRHLPRLGPVGRRRHLPERHPARAGARR